MRCLGVRRVTRDRPQLAATACCIHAAEPGVCDYRATSPKRVVTKSAREEALPRPEQTAAAWCSSSGAAVRSFAKF